MSKKKTDEEILADYLKYVEDVKRKILGILVRVQKKADLASYSRMMDSLQKTSQK